MKKISDNTSVFANTLIAIRISPKGTRRRQKRLSEPKFPSPEARICSACLHAHKGIRHGGADQAQRDQVLMEKGIRIFENASSETGAISSQEA